MPVVPLRDLAKFGIITDPNPYDLPPGAWSAGVNIRFVNGRVARGPVFRDVGPLANSDPRFLTSRSTVGGDDIFVCYKTGRVFKWTPTLEEDYSIVGYVDAASDSVFSSTGLSNCLYVNRGDRVPWVLTPAATDFVALANWDPTWRAKIMRSFNGSLVALNVTKGADSYPTMVKTSDAALFGVVPASWDEGDPTTVAYENVLTEMDGGITDGRSLGRSFFIYAPKETWVMTATGGDDLYTVRRVFNDVGAINANCVVEVGGRHFVFGQNDIWSHDGASRQSLAVGRVRDFIFNNLNVNNAYKCFVQHDINLKEIRFCYASDDSLCDFPTENGAGTNRCAVYNYVEDKWSFYDLPYVWGADISSVDTSLTWDDLSQPWDSLGGSWANFADGLKKGSVMVGEASVAEGLSTNMLYALDLTSGGAVFTFEVNEAATGPFQLKRDGIDLDEVGEELRGYKHMTALWPQARLAPDELLEFSLGAADTFNVDAEFSGYLDSMTYNGINLNKVDYVASGRYLGIHIRYDSFKDLSISGLDIELVGTGKRL